MSPNRSVTTVTGLCSFFPQTIDIRIEPVAGGHVLVNSGQIQKTFLLWPHIDKPSLSLENRRFNPQRKAFLWQLSSQPT
jgi:hypothetical protein